MQPSAAGKPAQLGSAEPVRGRVGESINRKIWLPRLFYEIVPWFYLVSGILAFLATVYISDWFWILPHYLLFSAACCHLGVAVLVRRRNRRRQSDDG